MHVNAVLCYAQISVSVTRKDILTIADIFHLGAAAYGPSEYICGAFSVLP